MTAFFVDDQAAAAIMRIFCESGVRHPIAKLYETADPGKSFDNLKAEFLRGDKTAEELAAIAKVTFDNVGELRASSLEVGVYDRSDFQPQDLIETNGITFAMGSTVAELLRGCCLTYEDARFVIKTSDGSIHTLLSLISARTPKP